MKSVDLICPICDISIMGDHDDRIFRLSMKYIDEIHYFRCIPFIEIPCRLIGEEVRHLCHECSRDGDALCLST